MAPRGQDITVCKRRVGACAADIRGLDPFSQPGAVVGEIDGIRRADAFGNRRAAFLSRANEPRELEQQILTFQPDWRTITVLFELKVTGMESIVPRHDLTEKLLLTHSAV
ncbi:hypothetical protein [Bradyrhizobium sp.]|uniref:hypothetical protein n=1 Tax=Bradyrhizobium sp. TaxID=376 RepID=UPI002CEFA7DA|nr:hypothetical protein [Bradyrhizobium sp.]HWX57625.1 hypothetical protein [Bradyrhizobium sp.]